MTKAPMGRFRLLPAPAQCLKNAKGDGAVRKDPERPSRVSTGGKHVGGPEETAEGHDGEGGGTAHHPGPGVTSWNHAFEQVLSSSLRPELRSLHHSFGYKHSRRVFPAGFTVFCKNNLPISAQLRSGVYHTFTFDATSWGLQAPLRTFFRV